MTCAHALNITMWFSQCMAFSPQRCCDNGLQINYAPGSMLPAATKIALFVLSVRLHIHVPIQRMPSDISCVQPWVRIIALFPGHSHRHHLIACRMQIWRGKAWEIWSCAMTSGRHMGGDNTCFTSICPR